MSARPNREDPKTWMKPPPGTEEARQQKQKANGHANDSRPLLQSYTLAELQRKEIKPMTWIVPVFFPEGLTVLAGRPKIRKSWLMLAVALAVARGTEVLGQLIERGGDVLYGAFEDGERRMKERVDKILGPANNVWPDTFHVIHKLDALDNGGLDDIERWLTDHPNRRLVVLDTFGRVRGQRPGKEDPYQHDTRIVGALQALATRFCVAIVIVHHVRKGDAMDILDTISGTTGIAGAADTPMVLARTKDGEVRLYLRGRDAEEQDKLVDFDPDTGIWSVIGDYVETDQENQLAGLRRNIVDLLQGSPRELTPAEIADRLKAKPVTVRQTARRMAMDGQIFRCPSRTGAYVAGRPSGSTN